MTPGKFICIFLLSLSSLVCTVDCSSKRWIWSTNWNDPRNWDRNRIPCNRDQIVVADGVIYAGKNITFNNLELPKNGEIILDVNSEVTIEETPAQGQTDKSCKGETIRFTGNDPKDWFNPLNWNFLENGSPASWNDATLFMDRIPCLHDTVSFPEGDAFSLTVGSNVEVAEVFLRKQSLNSAGLVSYLASNEGKLRFKNMGNNKIVVNEKKCQQAAGCPCGLTKMKTLICSKFQCPATCANKIKPEGDCCDRCGALVTMNINSDFNLDSCQNALRTNVATTNFKNALLAISPIEENNAVERVQILLTDKSDGKDAVGAAKSAVEYISQNGKANGCSVFNVKSTISTGGDTGRSKGSNNSSNVSAVALGVTLAIVCIILILGALYLLRRKRFRSFDINRQILHDEMEISGARNMEMKDTEFTKGVLDFDRAMGGESFENPMYDEVMHQRPAIIDPKIDSPQLERINARPLKKSRMEDKDKNVKKSQKTKSTKKNGKAKERKSESADAFENPVYGHMDFTQDLDDTFDASYDAPVPGDTGFNNPLYSGFNSGGKPEDVEEVRETEPPSFLDTIGFSPDDFDASIDINEFNDASVSTPQIKVDMIDDDPRDASEA